MKNLQDEPVAGIDLGGTHVRGGRVQAGQISPIASARIPGNGTEEEVLDAVFGLTDRILVPGVQAIGIGVPSVVDIREGIVYDVQNIPSWKEVPLKQLMEQRYGLPVSVNNDANCFALGEYYFGKGRGSASLIGLTIGTGLGAGIIIDHKLYAGRNCGAGEFGMVEYLDRYYEYYASGQFFQHKYGVDGATVFEEAAAGSLSALNQFAEMGTHLGNAIKMMQYTYDMELIILGGSVRHALPYFSTTMWERIRTCVFRKSSERLQILVSDLENSAILGAAALCYE